MRPVPRRAGSLWLLSVAGALAGCSSSDAPPAVAAGDEKIACAVAGASELKPVCAVERSETDGVMTLIVHHPNGGFRRFDVQSDGSGLKVSDGADAAVTRLADGMLDVNVGPDSYRFPVTARAHGKAADKSPSKPQE